MDLPSEQMFKVLAREAFVYRKAVVALFVAVTLVVAIVGLNWPQRYTSSTTILVQEKNIIQPLMQGTAVDSGVTSRASVAREMIYGHHIMAQIARDAGWTNSKTTPKQESNIIHGILIPHTSVTHVGDNRNLIRIQYTDTNAERAYHTAEDLTNLFIAATLSARAKESEDAFNFINQQVLLYRAKLTDVENALKKFQTANLTTIPGSEGHIGKRLSHLQDKIDRTGEELKEAEIKQNSLTKQLHGEAQATAEYMLAGQYAARIAKLQGQLATLRLNYRDTYPDIVQIKHEIAHLERDIENSHRRAKEAKGKSGQPVINESMVLNPLYQHLRQESSQTRTLIATLSVRLADYKKLMAQELARGRKVQSAEPTRPPLTRAKSVISA